MRKVLVAYASKHGATAEIAMAVGETMGRTGLDVDVRGVDEVADVATYDAVVVGSSVYVMRWRPEAVRFLRRNRRVLSGRPVWLFDSGPLDDSADTSPQPLPKKVASLADAIGIRGRANFGGKLTEDAKGFIARKMVEGGTGGDFRNFDRIREWATEVAAELDTPAEKT